MSSTIATPIGSRANALAEKPDSVVLAARRSSSSGIWVGVFAITMSFAAFSSALVVREGTTDWSHLVLPPLLYLNTVFILASSLTLELSRRALREAAGARSAAGWIGLTLLLGMAFCFGQYRAWLDLRAQGIYLATNPNSSFFYLLTSLHALHVLAGIFVLVYLAGSLLASHGKFRRSFFNHAAVYWHFMGVLWVYLFLLCRTKL